MPTYNKDNTLTGQCCLLAQLRSVIDFKFCLNLNADVHSLISGMPNFHRDIHVYYPMFCCAVAAYNYWH